ncbi:MAG TPA: penicillin-binding transpeptidase domain-containing protein, partial [Desulfotignum sp.]|nr:penicillin-binding transpeptidase domain-containing protein [Desulfotignum sp.]
RHQSLYLSAGKKKSGLRRWLLPFLILCFFSAAGFGAWAFLGQGEDLASLFRKPADLMTAVPDKKSPKQALPEPLTRAQVRELILEQELINAGGNEFIVDTPRGPLRMVTFLDMSLTRHLTATLDHLKTLTRGKPTQIGMVVMDAHEGHILAMAGFDLESDDTNPCTQAMYPAASIFKIVTAAAAVDALNYTPRTPLYFNGNKYTLYKRQLTDARNKHTVTVSFEKAFAESINPVFGKLGQLYLGRDTLAAYAHAFGFNQDPDADLTFDPGRFYINEDAFHLAELGSGYNRDTMISPVFGAMMITPLLNRGQALMPAVVSHVIDDAGQILYRHDKQFFSTAMSPQATDALVDLMKKTVSHGTARKSFGPVARDKVLSELEIGGKTGSLSNRTYTIKYDWFTGFARETQGTRAIVFSIVVGHGEYIGTRAAAHARSIITRYFTPAASES